jgi:hypothetical protein
MLQVFVNDMPQTIEVPAGTWGDLLKNLEEQVADKGLLLTMARFDGVDEPSFRDPEVTARRLSDVARVEVETATPGAFLRQCLLETIGPLDQAAEMAARLSAVYRRPEVSHGHEGLSRLANELSSLISLVAILGGPLEIDLGALTANGVTVAEQMDEFGAAIDALVAAQESEDWLTVADVLEYDLEPAIRRWIELLTVVANRL